VRHQEHTAPDGILTGYEIFDHPVSLDLRANSTGQSGHTLDSCHNLWHALPMLPPISFYHLQTSTLDQALPRLVIRALDTGQRLLIVTGSPARTAALDALLWTFDPNSFIPHGTIQDGHADRQPVWLSDTDENPNAATILFLVDQPISPLVPHMQRCLILFDGNDSEALSRARSAWKDYKAAGHALQYYQQDGGGRWQLATSVPSPAAPDPDPEKSVS
jgi:DNA polymerase III subunit chi